MAMAEENKGLDLERELTCSVSWLRLIYFLRRGRDRGYPGGEGTGLRMGCDKMLNFFGIFIISFNSFNVYMAKANYNCIRRSAPKSSTNPSPSSTASTPSAVSASKNGSPTNSTFRAQQLPPTPPNQHPIPVPAAAPKCETSAMMRRLRHCWRCSWL